MNVEFRKSQGTQEKQPLMVDTTLSDYVVYIRKNITYVTATDKNDASHWEYDECIIPKEDYEKNKEVILSIIFNDASDSIALINSAIEDLASAISKLEGEKDNG